MRRPGNLYRVLAALVALAAIIFIVASIFSGPRDTSASADTSTPAERAGDSPALIERGRYLAAKAGLCIECHTPHTQPGSPKEIDVTKVFQGGQAYPSALFGLPVPPFPETIYSANITPHANGIAGRTVAQIVATLKQGVDPQEDALRAGATPGGDAWGLDPLEGQWVRPAPDGRPVAQAVPNVRGDYTRYYAMVRDAIRGGGPAPVSLEEAVELMEWLDLGRRSAIEGRALSR